MLVDKRSKDKKKIDSKDSMDLSDFEKNSRDSLATESSSIAIEPAVLSMDPSAIVMELPTVSAIKTEPILSVPLLCNFETDNGLESMSSDIPSIHKSESSTSIDVCGADEVSTCIVCEKKFKSKTYMNKHLRSVHTGERRVPFSTYLLFNKMKILNDNCSFHFSQNTNVNKTANKWWAFIEISNIPIEAINNK